MKTKTQGDTPMHVWILAIDTNYGTDFTAYESYDLARARLMQYVKTYWDLDTPIPENQDDAIDTYFDGNHQDCYYLESATVQEAV